MNYTKLRRIFQEHFTKSFKNIKSYKHFSVVNEGFPGTFNLSFSETEFLKEFDSFLDVKHELSYIKIQPCIRHNDFISILKKKSKKNYMYLGLFDMAGVCFASKKPEQLQKQTEDLIESVYNFLVKKLGLQKNKIFIKYFSGGNVKEITNKKYEINKNVEVDTLSLKKWTQIGISRKNLIADKTRDSLLTLYLHRPTPWGYRTEILYKLKNKDFLDIGTIEYFPWKPVLNEADKITGFTKWENSCCLAVFGLERLDFLVNKLNHIKEVDLIKPLFEKILKDAKTKDKNLAFLVCESLRVSQRVLSDSEGYENLSRNRKRKLRDYLDVLFDSLEKLGLQESKLSDYLKINTKIQNYYPELKQNFSLVNNELQKFGENIKKSTYKV